jgi:hypothetical protein
MMLRPAKADPFRGTFALERPSVSPPLTLHSMDEGIPSISSGSVGSRFVSQTDLDKAKAVRDEQWKAAYAR